MEREFELITTKEATISIDISIENNDIEVEEPKQDQGEPIEVVEVKEVEVQEIEIKNDVVINIE